MPACRTCGRSLDPAASRCRNPLCASASRWFSRNVAITEHSGRVRALLSAYKYGGEQRWADLFGAMLAELLSGPGRLLDGFDLVVASPTYTGP
ncbi:MAG TPA: hypothetical protein VEK76_03010, partial [Candidatus Binatia bacterium]|nr:hypothetical protein [Candidatus Binatia bacterium]